MRVASPSPPALPAPRHEPHSARFVLGAIMLVSAMLGLAAAYGISSLVHHRGTANADEPQLSRTLVGKEFHIPRSWFRADEQASPSFAAEIDLKLMLPLGKLLSSVLFGVSGRDPRTLALSTVVVRLVGLLAGVVPAWRASRVNPTAALRAD